MSASNRGTIVAGIWLIAIGAVFLAQAALDLPWNEAWPLWVIAVGVGTGLSSLVALSGRRRSASIILWALVWPAIITAVGVLLFADLAGLADIDAVGILAQWWPLALIAIGLIVLVGALWPRQRGVIDQVAVPVGGAATGEVTIKFGAGRLDIGRGRPGMLVEGTAEGGAIIRDLGQGRVELETDVAQIWPWFGQATHWRLGLAPDLPLALRVEGGASTSDLQLGELLVSSLTVKTGASSTRIALPREVEDCVVRVESGAAQVSIEVPAGVAARIRSQMGLGSTNVDTGRFPSSPSGWQSPDYEASSRRVSIEVQGGLGSVRIS